MKLSTGDKSEQFSSTTTSKDVEEDTIDDKIKTKKDNQSEIVRNKFQKHGTLFNFKSAEADVKLMIQMKNFLK